MFQKFCDTADFPKSMISTLPLEILQKIVINLKCSPLNLIQTSKEIYHSIPPIVLATWAYQHHTPDNVLRIIIRPSLTTADSSLHNNSQCLDSPIRYDLSADCNCCCREHCRTLLHTKPKPCTSVNDCLLKNGLGICVRHSKWSLVPESVIKTLIAMNVNINVPDLLQYATDLGYTAIIDDIFARLLSENRVRIHYHEIAFGSGAFRVVRKRIYKLDELHLLCVRDLTEDEKSCKKWVTDVLMNAVSLADPQTVSCLVSHGIRKGLISQSFLKSAATEAARLDALQVLQILWKAFVWAYENYEFDDYVKIAGPRDNETEMELVESVAASVISVASVHGSANCLSWIIEVVGMSRSTETLAAIIRSHSDFAIHKAAEFGHSDVIKILLEHGAAGDSGNFSALRSAVRANCQKSVSLLLQYGSSSSSENTRTRIFTYNSLLNLANTLGYSIIAGMIRDQNMKNQKKLEILFQNDHLIN
ncbi:hypothetical protein HK098_002521 [Nowakowskiella sp. JEL0407]|nr:hypothetical protein HK098_002521 [Nowakowskiella sp. JEL0407]